MKDPDPFDWYQKYFENPNLKGTLNKYIPKTAAILVPGCGTSRLSEEMLADGYTGGIANIDISRTAIDLMIGRAKSREGLTCELQPPNPPLYSIPRAPTALSISPPPLSYSHPYLYFNRNFLSPQFK